MTNSIRINHPFINLSSLNKQVMTNIEEVWKDIPGYEGIYQASNQGRIRSIDRFITNRYKQLQPRKGAMMSVSLHRQGYGRVLLTKDRKSKTVFIHRLIALTFIPNPQEKKEVNHKNGIKMDNTVDNLEWCTPSENVKHAHRTGLLTTIMGEKHYKSKLSEEDVKKIRHDYAMGHTSHKKLAKEYNLNQKSIWAILHRTSWKHI